ncbi:MAG: hypothetical protein WD768_09735 [Phycisphaeraceae bacterium]
MVRLCILSLILLAAGSSFAADPPEPAPVPPVVPAPPKAAEPDPTRMVWFEDARYSPALSEETVTSVAAYVRHSLLLPDASPPLLNRQARDDFYPRIVFISVSDGLHRARVATGSARGVIKAADHALTQLRAKGDEKFEPRWVKVDVASTILFHEHADLTQIMDYERSLFGLALGRRTGVAMLPEELVGSDAILQQVFDQEKLAAYLAQRLPAEPYKFELKNLEDVYLFRFSTQSCFADAREILPLYRGHRQWRVLSKDDVLESCRAAAKYLVRAAGTRGQFAYLYQPSDDTVKDEYDWVAHFGAAASMFEVYEVLKDADLLAAARRALEHGELVTGSWTKNNVRVACIVERGRVALEANAMATLALATAARVTNDRTALERVRLFAEALVQAQRADGGFVHYEKYPQGEAAQEESTDAPGLAIAALTQVYRVDADARWLDAAEKAAKYLILVRDKNVVDAALPHDHWLMVGLETLQQERAAAIYKDHQLRLAAAIAAAQNRMPQYSDWLGSYFHLPNSTGTAVRNQGLAAAYAMSRRLGRESEATTALEALILGGAYQLTCQVRPEDAMYFADPQRSLGGIKEGHSATLIRIDYAQHHLASLTRLYRIMDEEKLDSIRVPPPRARLIAPDGIRQPGAGS